MNHDNDCPICAAMERFHVPQAASELFHQYADAVATSCEVLLDAEDEGFDFNEEPFSNAMDFMFEGVDEADKSKMN